MVTFTGRGYRCSALRRLQHLITLIMCSTVYVKYGIHKITLKGPFANKICTLSKTKNCCCHIFIFTPCNCQIRIERAKH
jgi:hypothetical protein